jgi:hypothetical protein
MILGHCGGIIAHDMGIRLLDIRVKAIGEYFSIGNGQKYKDQLTAKEWQDLMILKVMPMVFSTYRKQTRIEGLRISYATLVLL